MQLLLVDDSPVMRKYVSRVLELTGLDLTIREAANGREAMMIAEETRPDLIVTDLNMPEMNGAELLSAVDTSPALAGIPVVILSANRSRSISEEMIRAGAAAYLTKPVSPELLRDELLTIIESGKRTIPDSTLLDVLTRLFRTMYFCEPVSTGRGRLPSPSLSASIGFRGAANGRLCVAVTEHLAKQWTADLLALDAVTRLQASYTVSELANVAAGALLEAWLPAEEFLFSIPETPAMEGDRAFRNCFSVNGGGPEVAIDIELLAPKPPDAAGAIPELSFEPQA